MDLSTKCFWITLTGFKSWEYSTFKRSILGHYPGASKGQCYMVRELEHIIINQADSDINIEKELMQYYSQFQAVAVWLVTNSKISAQDCDKYFWQELPVRARCQILQWLKLKDPDFNHNELAHFEKVIEAGRHVFSDDAFDTEFNDLITLHIQSIRDHCTTPAPTNNCQAQDYHIYDSDDDNESHNASQKVQMKTVHFTSPQVPVQAAQNLLWIRSMHLLDRCIVFISGTLTIHHIIHNLFR